MKKFFKICTLAFCLIFVPCILVACGGNSLEGAISSNISEYRQNFFYGSNSNYTASFTDGKREQDFVTNGTSTPLVGFGVLVVRAKDTTSDNLDFELKINEEQITGTLSKNPFDNSYVIDVEREVSAGDKVLLKINSFDQEYTQLDNLSSEWAVNHNKALNIFVEHNKENLSKYYVDNVFSGEVYIKIVADKLDEGNIYWYVLCVLTDGNVMGSLISVKTGEILQN